MATALLILSKLRSLSNPKNVAGMARFGINPNNTLGISIPTLRKLAKECGKDNDVALELWDLAFTKQEYLPGL